jgi:hypothetical protein
VIVFDGYIRSSKFQFCDNCDWIIQPDDSYRRIFGYHDDNGNPFSLKLCRRCTKPPEGGGEVLGVEFPSIYEITREMYEAQHGEGDE